MEGGGGRGGPRSEIGEPTFGRLSSGDNSNL